MPILEVDLLYAALDPKDRHSEAAGKILKLIREEGIRGVKVDSLTLHELELNLKTGNILIEGKRAIPPMAAQFFKDLDSTLELYGIETLPLTCNEISKAVMLRARYRLTFYDSHHAAAALLHDAKIISTDEAYDPIKGIERLDPYKKWT